jgi:hypothetical protein
MYIDIDNSQHFSIHQLTPEEAIHIASCLKDCSADKRIIRLGKSLMVETEKAINKGRKQQDV